MSKPVVLSVAEWNPASIKFMPPKVNERGGKSINIISTQTNRGLNLATPMMMSWGIADFIGDNGESDGKFSISFIFPNEEHRKPATDQYLQKNKDLENVVLDSAVKNSELWWGEEMSREVLKHTFFPFLKYSKNKDTKKIDLTKPPSIRAKVPFYNGKWGVEIYDTKENLIFPCDNDNLTPSDFIPKLSQVAGVLQCGGIWIGGKGWGLTWKLVQCVVKPREVVTLYGKCHIQLSPEDRAVISSQANLEDDEPVPTDAHVSVFSTEAADSDEEIEDDEPVPTPSAPPVKKIVKKAEPESVPVAVEVPAEEPAAVKKKIVKKKAP